VRDHLPAILEAADSFAGLAADAVTDADIHAACLDVAASIDLAEEIGGAEFRAALAALRQAGARRTREGTPSRPDILSFLSTQARPSRRAFHFQEVFMADYFTHFSCLFDVGTPANAARALEIYDTAVLDGDPDHPLPYGFSVSIDETEGGTTLWIRD
jgi:hypothetical protein